MVFVRELVNTSLAEHFPKLLIPSQAMIALGKKKKKQIFTLIIFTQQSVGGIYIIQDIFVAGTY